MELRKLLPALPLSLVLGLGACTAPAEPTVSPTEQHQLRLIADADPMYQALAAVYAQQLEADGFSISLLEPTADPLAQVRDGQADLALSAGREYLARQQAAAAESEASGSPEDSSDTEDTGDTASPDSADTAPAVLSREEINQLVTEGGAAEFSRIEFSPGQLGTVLVMSGATMTLHEVTDLPEVIAHCAEFSFAADPDAHAQLQEALQDASCPEQVLQPAGTGDPADLLRTAAADVVAIPGTRAVIADEGFIPVPGSGELFDSEPVIAVAGAQTPQTAQDTLRELTGALNDQTLTAVNRMVQGPDPASNARVAEHWPWLIQ